MQISKSTLDFLSEVGEHNNKTWFELNKDWYEESYDEFKEFAYELAEEVSKFDESIKKSLNDKKTVKIFRIYRDMRFSNDKSPYKKNYGATIAPYGMESGNPGYYVHIQPNGESFVGGGLHHPSSEVLNRIRKKIVKDPDALRKIVKNNDFISLYGGISEYDTLKTVPRGYDKDHPAADLLRYKSLSALRYYDDVEVISKKFFNDALKSFIGLREFNEYLKVNG